MIPVEGNDIHMWIHVLCKTPNHKFSMRNTWHYANIKNIFFWIQPLGSFLLLFCQHNLYMWKQPRMPQSVSSVSAWSSALCTAISPSVSGRVRNGHSLRDESSVYVGLSALVLCKNISTTPGRAWPWPAEGPKDFHARGGIPERLGKTPLSVVSSARFGFLRSVLVGHWLRWASHWRFLSMGHVS